MFDLTRQERKALLFITIFIATGAVLKVLPFAIVQKQSQANQKISHQDDKKIRVNVATVSELVRLKGIGSSIALRIIEYRNKNGSFKSIDELMKVKGIGSSKYSQIKDSISL